MPWFDCCIKIYCAKEISGFFVLQISKFALTESNFRTLIRRNISQYMPQEWIKTSIVNSVTNCLIEFKLLGKCLFERYPNVKKSVETLTKFELYIYTFSSKSLASNMRPWKQCWYSPINKIQCRQYQCYSYRKIHIGKLIILSVSRKLMDIDGYPISFQSLTDMEHCGYLGALTL